MSGVAALNRVFTRLRRDGRKALIPFIMGGDPSLSATVDLLPALEEAGADLVEVGIPFSDPLADGPVIQAASARALAKGATPAKVLAAIAKARARLSIPVVGLSYWNPVVQFGEPSCEAFARAAAASGVSGLVIPDLPVEEGGMWQRAARAQGLATIFLAAPTSSPERAAAVARASRGFIYYVSVTGTTGARQALPSTLVSGVAALKRLTDKPVCVGFGISTPEQASVVARIADGVIVGSALLRAMGSGAGFMTRRRAVAFVKRLRAAV